MRKNILSREEFLLTQNSVPYSVPPNEEEVLARIVLLLLPRVGNYTANQWVLKYGDATKIIRLIREGKLFPSPLDLKHGFNEAVSILKWCAEHNIQIILSDSPLYPPSLFAMPSYPLVLFTKGNLSLLKHAKPYLSVLGKKLSTEFGTRAIQSIVEYICPFDIGITCNLGTQSGQQAAYSSIQSGHAPIVVSSNPLDQIMRNHHKKMAQYIIDNEGLLITDQIPGERNRNYYQILTQVRLQMSVSDALLLTESDPCTGTSFAALVSRQLELPIFATQPTNKWARKNPELIKLLRNDKSVIPIPSKDEAWKITNYFRLRGRTNSPLTLAKPEPPESSIQSVVAWN